jgi:hypothetical protein
MTFDLAAVRKELEGTLLASPYPPDLSAAVVSDTFRMARIVPPTPAGWRSWLKRRGAGLLDEQLGMLAHILLTTSLRQATIATLEETPAEPMAALPSFFDKVQPLTAEMIRSNAFRQEEFLRRWIEAVGGSVTGETPKQSLARLEQLDYRTTLEEFKKADSARKAEAARRAKLLQEARDKEAAARGWRE